MVAHTRRALDLAIQFRKAIALDLVTVSAQESYDLLKGTVQRALSSLADDPSYKTNRQEIDAAKQILHMAGLSEPQVERSDKDTARMTLAELNAMISDLKIIDNASVAQHDDSAPIDIFS